MASSNGKEKPRRYTLRSTGFRPLSKGVRAAEATRACEPVIRQSRSVALSALDTGACEANTRGKRQHGLPTPQDHAAPPGPAFEEVASGWLKLAEQMQWGGQAEDFRADNRQYDR
jgi:hypothetical protein